MIYICQNRMKRHYWPDLLPLLVVVVMMTSIVNVEAREQTQRNFTSPEQAVTALIEAIRLNDQKALVAILGPDAKEFVHSGDPVQDERRWGQFMKAFDEMNKLEMEGSDRTILHVGKQEWPLPIPIVKRGGKWFFDTAAGKEEILNRRIGRNELNVIEVVRAYADAQREYASKDRDGDGVLEFAQRFASGQGAKDGLFWDAKEGQEMSPFGPLAATAAKAGSEKKGSSPVPYHGYYFKVLKAQGKNAKGGAYDYVVNDNMIFGFALLAYPAQYRSSGIMTFMVNQEGIVYQKDLGKNTAQITEAIREYNPDKTWKKAE